VERLRKEGLFEGHITNVLRHCTSNFSIPIPHIPINALIDNTVILIGEYELDEKMDRL
jgi:hypothetical protein